MKRNERPDESKFVASFSTHLGAMEFYERLRELGDAGAVMAPVPRSVSVSCGTGVYFSMAFQEPLMRNDDLDAVYAILEGGRYKLLYEDGQFVDFAENGRSRAEASDRYK